MKKASSSAKPAPESGKSSEVRISKKSSANQAKRRSSISQSSRRSSINQTSKRSSISQASKRSSVNAARSSTIDSIAESGNDERNKAPLFNVNRVPVSSVDPRSGILPAHFPNKEWGNPHKRILRQKDVDEFLAVHPQVLLDFLYDTVELDTLEELLRQKKGVIEDEDESQTKTPEPRKASDLFDQDSTRPVSQELISAIERQDSCISIIQDFCPMFIHILRADSYKLYVQEGLDSKTFYLMENGNMVQCVIKGTVAGRALKKKTAILISDMASDSRFARDAESHDELTNNSSVLCVPLVLESKHVPAIIEMRRELHRNTPFIETDVQIANITIGWIAACISENIDKRSLISQQFLIDFLLENTKELFDGVTKTEELVPKIMRHTKDLVKADRCSLFLVDHEKEELYANYFDEGAKSTVGIPLFEKKEIIRFPKGVGIAGHVAKTAEVVNILDAYEDPRFNKEVDKLTGYRTKNILCMPIINRNCVIGVIQMVNSMRSDHFTTSDESALRMFTAYCAIALHYNNFYSSLERQRVKNKACIEVIQYHTVCHKASYTDLLHNPGIDKREIPKLFYTYDFYAPFHLEILPKLFIRMVEELWGKDRIEREKLVKFILTVRKNYRNIPYHNFPHGFHVAHTLWRMIVSLPNTFTEYEKMGLIVAGICHDVDHRGYNNDFFKKMKLPLANLYSTSVMEQHHYRQTVTILQTEDIFSFLSSEKYKEMLGLIRQCILATDLALYFGNQKTLQALLDGKTFDITDQKCRNSTIDLMMTASDLCGISKPWKTNKSSTNQLYQEFYDQGDKEKQHGFEPMSMMDRSHSDEIPKQQVGFIDFICFPLYKTLARIFPGTKPLLSGCLRNRRKWLKIAGIAEDSKMLMTQESDDDDHDHDEEDEEDEGWVNVFNVKDSSENRPTAGDN